MLTKLAKQNKLKLNVLNLDDSLKGLCVRIRLKKDNFNNRLIEIDIPRTLTSNNLKRICNCFSFWIPYCFEIYKKAGYSFSLSLNASDWGNNEFLSMTSSDINNIIPDEYAMFESRKVSNINQWNTFEKFYKQWIRRKNTMFWRGSTTGHEITSIQSLQELQRIKVSLLYKNKDGFDIKLTNVVENKIPKQIIKQWLNSNHIFGRKVLENRFRNFKYYPDIPGNNNLCGSWGTIKKYLRGNLIFKPDHKSQMFYDRFMIPWKHFIPVDSDFMDLGRRYQWAEENQQESARIAWRGCSIANLYLRNIKNHFIDAAVIKIKPIKN